MNDKERTNAPEKTKATVDEEQTRLLEKMIKRQERDIRLNRITAYAECALLTVLIIVFAILVPRFFRTVQKVEDGMDDVSSFLDESRGTITRVNSIAGQVEEAMSEAMNLADQAEEAMSEAMNLADQAEEAMSEVIVLAENANEVVIANDEAISEAIDHFNSVDFETLNQSIQHIEEIIKPVADLARAIME